MFSLLFNQLYISFVFLCCSGLWTLWIVSLPYCFILRKPWLRLLNFIFNANCYKTFQVTLASPLPTPLGHHGFNSSDPGFFAHEVLIVALSSEEWTHISGMWGQLSSLDKQLLSRCCSEKMITALQISTTRLESKACDIACALQSTKKAWSFCIKTKVITR